MFQSWYSWSFMGLDNETCSIFYEVRVEVVRAVATRVADHPSITYHVVATVVDVAMQPGLRLRLDHEVIEVRAIEVRKFVVVADV